jgi:hypothetical protein
MKLPLIQGLIDRRILANYRVAPEFLAPLLPAPFRPKFVSGHGIAGICLIRLKQIRPRSLPGFLGIGSENAAHRIAVEWTDENGATREGVYIPRRDSSSRLNVLAGGRIFAGVHHHARFDVHENNGHFRIDVRSDDGATRAGLTAQVVGRLPAHSIFPDLEAASSFFRGGSLGYSPSADGARLDALELHSLNWRVTPLKVDRFESTFFDDRSRFPAGSIAFDCALLMQNVQHEWHERTPLACEPCAAV